MSDVMDAVENNKAGKGRRQVQQWGVCVCVCVCVMEFRMREELLEMVTWE